MVAEHYDAGGSRACWRPWNISRAGLDERSVYFLARLSRATRPWRSGSLTSASTPTPRRWPPRRGRGSPGQEPTRSPGRPSMCRSSAPASSIMSTPALTEHGDTETIARLLHRLDQRGTGAGRQRALFTSGASTPAFITALARATLSGDEPARPRPPTARAGPGGSAMAARESPAGKPVAGAAAQRPGPGPRAGPDGDPGHAGAGDRRPGPGRRCGAGRRVGRCRGRGRRGLLAAADGEGGPRDDPRRDGQHGSDQRSHGAAAPGPGLSTP